MGLRDLELWKKVRGTRSRWEKVVLPSNLPPVDLSYKSEQDDSISPPPGRPGHLSRGSSDSECGQSLSKVNKNKIIGFSDALEKAQLVGEASISPVKEGEGLNKKPDNGRVFSVSATPVKQKLPIISQESPIFSSKCNKQ